MPTKTKAAKGWIGVDLDATLAHYDGWKGIEHIGEPVPAMAERVRGWIAQGIEVRIVTARMSEGHSDREDARRFIEAWAQKHFGIVLYATCSKDYDMLELYDDRCVAVEPNTGRLLNPSRRGL